MIIGVFDSGKGGELLAQELAAALPDHEVITELDVQNVPYGLKTPDQIYGLTKAGLDKLSERGADILVLACNTATTIIDRLREHIAQPLIGLEPMVKPACDITRSGIIAVLATPATLASDRYQKLKASCTAGCRVLEPDCAQWSAMIQHDAIDWELIDQTVDAMLAKGADVLVLGCTHYHVLEDYLQQLVGDRAVVIQPSQAIIGQVRSMLG